MSEQEHLELPDIVALAYLLMILLAVLELLDRWTRFRRRIAEALAAGRAEYRRVLG